jgi:hypothetical protein
VVALEDVLKVKFKYVWAIFSPATLHGWVEGTITVFPQITQIVDVN